MSLYRVPARLLPDLWPALEPYAIKACRNNPFVEAPDLLAILLAGRAQLFLATQDSGIWGFSAVEMVEYPRRKVANVFAAAGARGFLSVLMGPLLELMKEWAIEQGADTLSTISRPGYLRFARRLGASELTYHVAWMGLGDVRRRRQANNDQRALETGPAVSSGHLRSGESAL